MSDDSESTEDINAVIREQRRRSTITSIGSNVLYPNGTMLPNSVVRNQEFSAERRRTITSTASADEETFQAAPRRGSYWNSNLVESIRNSLNYPEKQISSDDLTNSDKELFRQNKIKVESFEQDRTYSPSDLSEQEKRRLRRAQRRTLAVPVITDLRRATQESLRVAMEISEEMEFTDDEIMQDICVDKRHKHKKRKHHDNKHYISNSSAHKHYANMHNIKTIGIKDDEHVTSKHVINTEKSLAKVNVHVSIHDEKHSGLHSLQHGNISKPSVLVGAANVEDPQIHKTSENFDLSK